MEATYSPHYYDHAEGHIFINKPGACTITLTGAASMTQDELDRYGELFALALSSVKAGDPRRWISPTECREGDRVQLTRSGVALATGTVRSNVGPDGTVFVQWDGLPGTDQERVIDLTYCYRGE